ncbi:MAG: hypothetical protein H5T68_09420 [Chloroflexi bacterium]|nr:hypothetical protein [Chloroflexota bacterium]
MAISNVTNLGAFQFTLAYSPSLVHVQDITLGPFPGSSGRNFIAVGPAISNTIGTATFGAYSLGSTPPGPSGSGVLAHLRLLPHAVGTALLDLTDVQVTNVPGVPITPTIQDGILHISACMGDFDGDGDVDVVDVQRIAYRWGSRCEDGRYDPIYDLDGDCDIDIVDVQRVAYHWGTRCGSAATTVPIQLAALQPVTITLQPHSRIASVGQTFTVGVHISNTVDLGAFEFTLAYSPTILEVITATLGSFPGSTGRTVVPVGPVINPGAGMVTYGAYSLGSTPEGPTGDGLLAILTLRALAEGESSLNFTAAQVSDRAGNMQPIGQTSGGEVVVTSEWRIYLPVLLRRVPTAEVTSQNTNGLIWNDSRAQIRLLRNAQILRGDSSS